MPLYKHFPILKRGQVKNVNLDNFVYIFFVVILLAAIAFIVFANLIIPVDRRANPFENRSFHVMDYNNREFKDYYISFSSDYATAAYSTREGSNQNVINYCVDTKNRLLTLGEYVFSYKEVKTRPKEKVEILVYIVVISGALGQVVQNDHILTFEEM
jgi:hypothetical protein